MRLYRMAAEKGVCNARQIPTSSGFKAKIKKPSRLLEGFVGPAGFEPATPCL